MEEVISERYLGFYLSKPFWAINAVDITSDVASNFSDLMSEEVYKFDNPKFNLIICRDGMFLLRLKKISEIIENNISSVPIISDSLNAWSDYLKYANTIALLFESVFLQESKFSYFETRELTNKDAFGVSHKNSKCDSYVIADGSTAEKFQMARYLSTIPYNHFPLSSNPLFINRPIVEKSIFDQLANDLNNIFDKTWLVSLGSVDISHRQPQKCANHSYHRHIIAL